ncbi:MAG: biotin transporter BioY [Phycisphaerales bacterium JB043]
MTHSTSFIQTQNRTPSRSLALKAALVVGGTLLITLGAQARIPLYPVPITLQTLAVFLVAGALGLRLGVSATALYLVLGLAGLPVFSGATSWLTMQNFTLGYLIGFIPAAALMGVASDKGLLHKQSSRLVALIYATAIVFIPGVLWLSFVTLGTFEYALEAGLFPFIPGAIVKIIAAAIMLPTLTGLVHKANHKLGA